MDEALRDHLQQINTLLLTLVENLNVVKAVSWDTIGKIREIYEENKRRIEEQKEVNV